MHTAVLGLALLAALALGATTAHAQAPAYVTRVVDGDIIYAEFHGRLEAVRYLGVNRPHVEHPAGGIERYAAAAREANRRLVEGKWVHLRFDGPGRDRHGRLLAYVWVGDLLVNAALVHRGYAEAAAASHAGYAQYFRMLQDGAQRDGRGVWREPEARAHHRPRPTELAADEERGSEVAGGRVFSAPAPFFPTSSSPAGASPARGGSPSYVSPTRSIRR
jgi:micrococcal nuclease